MRDDEFPPGEDGSAAGLAESPSGSEYDSEALRGPSATAAAPENSAESQTTVSERNVSFSFSLLPEGVEWSAGLLSILLVYVVQGATDVTTVAQSLFLKDTLGLDAAASAALTGLAAAPWVIKPLYGFLSDTVPFFGFRRKSYLIAAGILGTAAWLSLGTFVSSAEAALAAILARNLAIAFADVVVDSLCVETSRREGIRAGPDKEQRVAAALQSFCFSSRQAGALAASLAVGPLLDAFQPRQIFEGAAVLPLAIALAGVLVQEDPASSANVAHARAGSASPTALAAKSLDDLRSVVVQRRVWLPAAVVLFLLATPSSGEAYFYFLTDEIGLGGSALGRLNVISSSASLIGVLLYRRFLVDVRPSRLISTASILSAVLVLPQLLLVTRANRDLGVPDDWLIYGDDAVQAALGQVLFLPTLTLAARLCPPGQEGTLFALLASSYNAAGIASRELGALLTNLCGVTGGDFSGLPTLVGVCALTSLLPLPLLPLLDKAGTGEDVVAEINDEK